MSGQLNKRSVMLVDDHVLVRAGIRALVDQLDDFQVTAEAADNAAALVALQSAAPNILVTDLSLGKDNGLELVRQVCRLHPHVAIVVLSMHDSESAIAGAFKAGACAYVTKDAAPEDLAHALRAAAVRAHYLSPSLTLKMMNWSVHAPTKPEVSLTQRQSQILGMIGACKNTKQIAFELQLSAKTVAAHRAQIMERVGVRDRVGLAMLARERGLAGPVLASPSGPSGSARDGSL